MEKEPMEDSGENFYKSPWLKYLSSNFLIAISEDLHMRLWIKHFNGIRKPR